MSCTASIIVSAGVNLTATGTDNSVIVVEGSPTLTAVQTNYSITQNTPVETIEVGVQGPRGLRGFTGNDAGDLPVPYNTNVDFVGDTVIYKGWSEPGTSESSPLWRIQQITFVGTDEDVVILWANGNGDFTNVWDNRASLAYS